jgi:U4/U6.U5 tri-snRNP-associated protein 1
MSDNDDQGEISMSIDDTNKLRAKLGLPPLETEPVADIALDNFNSYKTAEKRKLDREELKKTIQKEKNKKSSQRKAGVGLGHEGIDDSLAWITSMKNKKMYNEETKEEQVAYTSADLSGLKVGHDLGSFSFNNRGRDGVWRDYIDAKRCNDRRIGGWW